MRLLILAISVVLSVLSFAEPVANPTMKLPAKGFIQDTDGAKHWYKTSVAREDYFIGDDVTGETYRMKFEADDYLPNDDGSKMVLANIITRFFTGSFVHADGKFETRFSDWKKAAGLQRRGISSQAPIILKSESGLTYHSQSCLLYTSPSPRDRG